MSWEHGTYGWESYENFIRGLEAAGITCAEELKDESYARGQDLQCQCYCGYWSSELPPGDVVVATLYETTDEVFQEALDASDLTGDEKAYALRLRESLREYGRETCPCCLGTCGHTQQLRIGRYTAPDGKSMVVEEYLMVKDQDCDGRSLVGIVVYEEGHRPKLVTRVLPA